MTVLSFQCWRGFRWNISHKCDCYKRGHVHLHPTWHLQVHLQDRHHLVPIRRPGEFCPWYIVTHLWRPGLRHEVWELDVRRVQGRPQAESRGRGPGHLHQQWGVGSSKWDKHPIVRYSTLFPATATLPLLILWNWPGIGQSVPIQCHCRLNALEWNSCHLDQCRANA